MTVFVNDGDSYTHNGNLYGRVNSDSTVCAQVKRLKEIREKLGVQYQYFITRHNTVSIRWNSVFTDYETLEKRFPVMQLDKEVV